MLPARWAVPVGILQSHPGVLAVSVPETDAAELTSNAVTFAGTTDRLHIQSLLTALMATRTFHLKQNNLVTNYTATIQLLTNYDTSSMELINESR